MTPGKITGSIGESKKVGLRDARFYPQGIAYPASVSAGLVQDLIGSYGSRSLPTDMQVKRSTYVGGGAAHVVGSEGAKYAAIAASLVAGIEGMTYAAEVLGKYPGGKSGLINEIADVFYQYMSGNSTTGEARLGLIQAGFEEAVGLVSKERQANMQNQIDYLLYISDRMTKELPYGEAWFLETAEANIRATHNPSSMKKWQWDELLTAEAQRLRWIASETERNLDAYNRQIAELKGFANTIGPALSELVTRLFGAVSTEIQKIAAEAAKANEAEQAAAREKYCAEQTAAMNNYIRLTKEFNDVIEAALMDFTAANSEYWVKVGI